SLAIVKSVYDQVPYLTEVFEQKFNQKLLSRIADGGFNLSSRKAWTNLSDLKDEKIGGAGVNLNWLQNAGVVPVSASLASAYTEMTTGVYNNLIIFPSAYLNLKLYEPNPYYTLIGFGSMAWLGMTINLDTYNSLPPEVQTILLEVAADYEEQTGLVNKANYDKEVAQLRTLATVTEIAPEVRQQWAQSLAPWVKKTTQDLEAQGLPAKQVMTLLMDTAEQRGHVWPVHYPLD
ncbi:MAG: hypothetical protein U1D06_07750, partial [Paracoccaceae bacterium]|nr:hypothetical protein [Paracoccaceae bacterium]